MSFCVRVQPRSPREEIAGERQGALVVRLKAPPVEGAANEALLRFLSRALRVPAASLEILRGGQARDKVVRARGVSAARVSALLKGDAA